MQDLAMNSSRFFAVVTGQPLSTTEDYYKLICIDNTPNALLQVALFSHKPTKQKCRTPASGALPKQQQQRRSTEGSPLVVAATEHAAVHPLPQNYACSTKLCTTAPGAVAAECSPAATAAQNVTLPAGTDAIRPTSASPAQVGAATSAELESQRRPVLTSSLLDFSIWGDRNSTCAHAAAAAAEEPYNELYWLQDLPGLIAEAQQHL